MYRALNKTWGHVKGEIEKRCRENEPVELMQGDAWTMSATIRPSLPTIADKLALQLGAIREPW